MTLCLDKWITFAEAFDGPKVKIDLFAAAVEAVVAAMVGNAVVYLVAQIVLVQHRFQ